MVTIIGKESTGQRGTLPPSPPLHYFPPLLSYPTQWPGTVAYPPMPSYPCYPHYPCPSYGAYYGPPQPPWAAPSYPPHSPYFSPNLNPHFSSSDSSTAPQPPPTCALWFPGPAREEPEGPPPPQCRVPAPNSTVGISFHNTDSVFDSQNIDHTNGHEASLKPLVHLASSGTASAQDTRSETIAGSKSVTKSVSESVAGKLAAIPEAGSDVCLPLGDLLVDSRHTFQPNSPESLESRPASAPGTSAPSTSILWTSPSSPLHDKIPEALPSTPLPPHPFLPHHVRPPCVPLPPNFWSRPPCVRLRCSHCGAWNYSYPLPHRGCILTRPSFPPPFLPPFPGGNGLFTEGADNIESPCAWGQPPKKTREEDNGQGLTSGNCKGEAGQPQECYDGLGEEEEEHEEEDEEPQFVLSDEWAQFFARSEARRKEKKRQQKKDAKAARKAAKAAKPELQDVDETQIAVDVLQSSETASLAATWGDRVEANEFNSTAAMTSLTIDPAGDSLPVVLAHDLQSLKDASKDDGAGVREM